MRLFSQDDKTLVLKEAAYETPQPRTRRSGVKMRPTMRKAKEARGAGRVQGELRKFSNGDNGGLRRGGCHPRTMCRKQDVQLSQIS